MYEACQVEEGSDEEYLARPSHTAEIYKDGTVFRLFAKDGRRYEDGRLHSFAGSAKID